MRISADLAVSSSAQKDRSHWEPSLDCRAGVVRPVAPENKQYAVCYRMTSAATSSLFDAVSYTHLTLPTNREV